MKNFIKCGDIARNVDSIAEINCSKIEELQIEIKMKDGISQTIIGMDAINFVYQVCPVMFEGKRMKWPKMVWVCHNLFGHPIMQILCFFRMYHVAFWIHDSMVPKPIGQKHP